MSTVHLQSSAVSPLRNTVSDQSCHYPSASPNKPARTSSVYLMILSASDVYIVATKTRSRELRLQPKRNTRLAIYRPCGVCEYLLSGRSVIYWPLSHFMLSHSPELGPDLLARWGMSQI